MSDWWARKLGARQHEAGTPAQQVHPPQNLPPGYQPQQQPLPPPQQFDPNQVQVTTHNLFEMAGHWKGGQAHQVDTQPCPQCGGNQFFSRTNGHSRLPPPAPHCYNCGYNGLFDQGDPSTWGATS